MKKVFSFIIAAAMATTLAFSASAATKTLDVDGGGDFNKVHFAGKSVMPPPDAINYELIKGVRFTFDIPNFDHGDKPCEGKCVAVAYNTGPTDWTQTDFCYEEKKTHTEDFSAFAYDPATETGLDWLQLAAASWIDGNDGTCAVEVLGEGGVVLSLGQQTLNTATQSGAGGAGGATGGGSTGSTDPSLQGTGLGGVAILGGVAVLAAGAVAITRKRK